MQADSSEGTRRALVVLMVGRTEFADGFREFDMPSIVASDPWVGEDLLSVETHYRVWGEVEQKARGAQGPNSGETGWGQRFGKRDHRYWRGENDQDKIRRLLRLL